MVPISNRTFLMKKGTSGYEKFLDIKDYPDIFGEREALEVTTLSDDAQVYTQGIRSQDGLRFTHNYSSTDFTTVKTHEAAGLELDFALYFGGTDQDTPTGSDGEFYFKGLISASIVGKGVNEPREFISTIMPTTEITTTEPTTGST